MNIEVRFFASVRVKLNTSVERITVPEAVKTIGDVRQFLATRGGAWEEALGPDQVLRMAYDHRMSPPETAITEGCEVAFFPPVTGG